MHRSSVVRGSAKSCQSARIGHRRSHRVKAVEQQFQAPSALDGLIFKTGGPGSWDEKAVGSPVVRCYLGDNEERWVMWYSGRGSSLSFNPQLDAVAPSCGATGVAISSDGVNWLRGEDQVLGLQGPTAASDVGQIMTPNSEDWWWFDTCAMQVSDVQIFSNSSVNSGTGVFWKFYSGGDFTPISLAGSGLPSSSSSLSSREVEGVRMRPGLAMSQDGRNWARIEADHHSGALLDIGEEGSFDDLFIATPQVIAIGPKDMRMHYHTFDRKKKRFVIGLATSADGFKWTKKGVTFDPASSAGASDHDALGATAIHVTRDVDNRQYVMFYESVATDNTRSIGLAVSKDASCGSWQRCPTPVFTRQVGSQGKGGGAWDGGSVGQPCAVSMSGGKWRLYYAGRRSGGQEAGPYEGIGLAATVEGGAKWQGVNVEFRRREA